MTSEPIAFHSIVGPAAHRDPWSLAPSARAARLQSGPVTAGTAPVTARLEVGDGLIPKLPGKSMWDISISQVDRGELELCSLQLQQSCFRYQPYYRENDMSEKVLGSGPEVFRCLCKEHVLCYCC